MREEVFLDHPDIAQDILEQLEAFVDLAPSRSDPPLGTLGDYTLRRQIGRGGMGTVYDAWQNSMDRQVALKVLPRALAADTKAVTRFVREAQLAGKLDHPNVVHVHGMGLEEQVPYYAMEFVDGETLAEVLATIRDADDDTKTPFGKKSEQQFYLNLAKAFADVADGLQHAHSKGVVHRDIKPSNLILDGEGRLRILDFGLARLEGQESLTVSGDLVGTPLYMSPEQAKRRQVPIDHRTDVYSLGATLYEAITGRPPFRGKGHQDTLSQIIERDPRPPRQWNRRVPMNLETIVLKCLRKDVGDRYGTAEALGQDLRRFVRGDPIEAKALTSWERLARRAIAQRRKLAAWTVVVVLLATLGIVGYLLSSTRSHLESVLPREATEVLGGFFDDPKEIVVDVEGHIFGPAVSADELTLYFSRHEGNPRGDVDIYFMRRTSRDVDFTAPTRAPDDLNSPYEDWAYGNCLSPDGLEIYFTSTRPGSQGKDLWVARFKDPGNPAGGFHEPENLGPGVNTFGQQGGPGISADGLRLYFVVYGDGAGKKIYMASRQSRGDRFENPVCISSRLGSAWLSAASADGLTLFWTGNHPHGRGGGDIWISTRRSITDILGQPLPFENLVTLGPPINTDHHEGVPCLTPDWPRPGSSLYFGRFDTGGAARFFRATWHLQAATTSERGAEVRGGTEGQ